MGAYNNLKINNGVWNVNRVGRVLFFYATFFLFFFWEKWKDSWLLERIRE